MSASFHLRPATAADARMIWSWRNDPVSRTASRDTQPISWKAHAAWFPEALASRRMLIGELAGEPIGVVRFDPTADGWRVNLNLAPDMRGKGLGVQLLTSALAAIDGRITAEIREGNAASERVFTACGFHKMGRNGAFNLFRRG